jgi:hypothetical protein
MLLWENLTLHHMSTVSSPFSSGLITSNFSSIPIVFHWFFTWIVPGDVDLCFPLSLARKANAVEEENRWAVWLHYYHNQSIHVTDRVTESIFAGLQHKKRSTTDRICHIASNQTPIPKFKKWRKFSCHIREKLCEKRPACTVFKSVRVTTTLNEIKTKQIYLLPCHLH